MTSRLLLTASNQSHKWFSGEKAEISQQPKNIKIGEEIKPTKKVAWADEIESDTALSSVPLSTKDNFFKNLKPKQPSDQKEIKGDRIATLEKKIDEIHDMLQQLLDRQQV